MNTKILYFIEPEFYNLRILFFICRGHQSYVFKEPVLSVPRYAHGIQNNTFRDKQYISPIEQNY